MCAESLERTDGLVDSPAGWQEDWRRRLVEKSTELGWR